VKYRGNSIIIIAVNKRSLLLKLDNMYVCMYVRMYVYMDVCMYVCMYVCVCVYIYIVPEHCWCGPDSINGIATGYATGWTVRGSNPGGGEIFRSCPDRPWGPPSLLSNGYLVFPCVEAAGAWG